MWFVVELIVIIGLARSIVSRCKAKGRSAAGWVVLYFVLWLGGEIIGGVIGLLLSGGKIDSGAAVCGLVGAAVGILIAFIIVNNLPTVETEEEYYRRAAAARTASQLPDERYDEKFTDFQQRENQAPSGGAPQDPGHFQEPKD
jgi:hypothetical protein